MHEVVNSCGVYVCDQVDYNAMHIIKKTTPHDTTFVDVSDTIADFSKVCLQEHHLPYADSIKMPTPLVKVIRGPSSGPDASPREPDP